MTIIINLDVFDGCYDEETLKHRDYITSLTTEKEKMEFLYAVELARAFKYDDHQYFVDLLSPLFFPEIEIAEKVSQVIASISVSLKKKKQKPYLKLLILSKDISKKILENSTYWKFLNYHKNYINDLISLKNLEFELPINEIIELKKIKV